MCVAHSLRFASGATPADLLAASMAAELFFSTYLRAGISGVQKQHQCETKQAGRHSYAGTAKKVNLNQIFNRNDSWVNY